MPAPTSIINPNVEEREGVSTVTAQQVHGCSEWVCFSLVGYVPWQPLPSPAYLKLQ